MPGVNDPDFKSFSLEEDYWKAEVSVDVFGDELYQANLRVNVTLDRDGIVPSGMSRGELLGGDQENFRGTSYDENKVLSWAERSIQRILSRADRG